MIFDHPVCVTAMQLRKLIASYLIDQHKMYPCLLIAQTIYMYFKDAQNWSSLGKLLTAVET